MPITRDTLRGYILEEVLAYLIRGTGYKLLVHPNQDPDNLIRRGNGLGVKGRGSDHQADVLGELLWIPAFTFPLRLFVEAKFRSGKTGIGVVNNAVGVLLDINQRSIIKREERGLRRYYRYEFAIFSTSGFSKRAIDMAITHQISLIDLSGSEFSDLRQDIDRSAGEVIDFNEQQYEIYGDEAINRSRLVTYIRNELRKKLGTWPEGIEPISNPVIRMSPDALSYAVEVAREYRELFIAMADGPFMLLLKERTPGEFIEYADSRRSHRIDIHWSRSEEQGLNWVITPMYDTDAYRLTFQLPETLAEWIFSRSDFAKKRALMVKEEYFSNITIYRFVGGQDYLYRLVYDPEPLLQAWQK